VNHTAIDLESHPAQKSAPATHQGCLVFFAFDGNEPHRRAAHGLAYQGCSVLSIEAQLGYRLIPTESGGVSVLPYGSDLVEAKYVGHSSSVVSIDAPVIHDLHTMETY
jgi:hypothetical protein